MTIAVVSPGAYSRRALALLPLGFLFLLALLPLGRLLLEGWDGVRLELFADDYLQGRLLWSLAQAAITCVLTAVIGVPLAWVLARLAFPGRALLLRLMLLPFVMPTLVAGLGVLTLFGPRGISGLNLQDTPWLLLYGNLFYNLPLVVRASVDGLLALPASRLLAARSLGASPWRAFWRIELPALMPWLSSSLCLVFLYCFSGFGLALLLGGQQWATIEVEIYTLVAYELNLADAGALALAAMLVSATAALFYAALEARMAVPAKTEPLALLKVNTLRRRVLLASALLVLLSITGAPLLALLARAATVEAQTWRLLLNEDTALALFNTLRFSLMALLLASLLGVLHALAARRSTLMRAAAFLPFVVSPVCVAFGLLLLYPGWTASLLLLVSAYALLAYPFIAKSLAAALDALPPNLPAAARTLGATPWRSFWRVSWPWLRPAFRRGLAFAAATTVGEFAVTLFLSRPEWLTLTTLIYQHLGRPGQANLDAALLLSVLLMLFALLAFAAIEWPEKNHAPDR
ncbi:ABC transporter permease [Craterilacuibacter sinensis]|uniref:ABC transporter permease subunit n=1 Tax=Craterilacuibacter sinensis TaxID=2686017 RepID=A0A845BKA4_9NEIS|nr:ABC transporter permease subunit [Craterilacuibacter sinensis]MXR36755.1 ABC transporter permease subunit [Craterilacuibacter sinensis]